MTRQIPDIVYYKDQDHVPLSITGKGLPYPKDFDLRPLMMHTACWRGFYCNYAIRQERLWLTHLVVRHNGEYPIIGDVKALYEEERFLAADEEEPAPLRGRRVGTIVVDPDKSKIGHRMVSYDGGIYAGLNVPAPLTGGILLGIDDVDVPYIQYDLHYLITSKVILELLFDNGNLVKTNDLSAEVDQMRKYALKLPEMDHKSDFYIQFETEVKTWMRSILSLEYKFLDMKNPPEPY